jgi:hypothetical protein
MALGNSVATSKPCIRSGRGGALALLFLQLVVERQHRRLGRILGVALQRFGEGVPGFTDVDEEAVGVVSIGLVQRAHV